MFFKLGLIATALGGLTLGIAIPELVLHPEIAELGIPIGIGLPIFLIGLGFLGMELLWTESDFRVKRRKRADALERALRRTSPRYEEYLQQRDLLQGQLDQYLMVLGVSDFDVPLEVRKVLDELTHRYGEELLQKIDGERKALADG